MRSDFPEFFLALRDINFSFQKNALPSWNEVESIDQPTRMM